MIPSRGYFPVRRKRTGATEWYLWCQDEALAAGCMLHMQTGFPTEFDQLAASRFADMGQV